MAAKRAMIGVAPSTLRLVKEIKEQSGIAVGRLADLGLTFLCSEIQEGRFVIQNGQIIFKPEKVT